MTSLPGDQPSRGGGGGGGYVSLKMTYVFILQEQTSFISPVFISGDTEPYVELIWLVFLNLRKKYTHQNLTNLSCFTVTLNSVKLIHNHFNYSSLACFAFQPRWHQKL